MRVNFGGHPQTEFEKHLMKATLKAFFPEFEVELPTQDAQWIRNDNRKQLCDMCCQIQHGVVSRREGKYEVKDQHQVLEEYFTRKDHVANSHYCNGLGNSLLFLLKKKKCCAFHI